jgi:dTDP-glucose 4,6-dehydratase
VTILVTGGAGFIGGNFVLEWLDRSTEHVVNLDALTYAGNLVTLQPVMEDSRHTFVHGDVCDEDLVRELLARHRPRAILHFAAESHVDRSIHGPAGFVRTNVTGTFNMLEAARSYYGTLRGAEQQGFRFLHVSTDEVYGSLEPAEPSFVETGRFAPNSPYAASKAAADHFARAWCHTFGLPVIITNCSNNYGPYQLPEKLIPLMVATAVKGGALPVYGDGGNVRDWLYVSDHCAALRTVLQHGRVGETYNVGGNCERTNIDVVRQLCELLDELRPSPSGRYERLITYVRDRPGHDRRYAVDCSKLTTELGWRPRETFETGLRKTVVWYLANDAWVERVSDASLRQWLEDHYGNGSRTAEAR